MRLIFWETFLWIKLISLGILLTLAVREKRKDLNWLLLLTAPALLYSFLVKTGFPEPNGSDFIAKIVPAPLWIIIPLAVTSSVHRKISPGIKILLISAMLIHLIINLFFNQYGMPVRSLDFLFALAMLISFLTPLLHLTEIRLSRSRIVVVLYFFIVFCTILVNLPFLLTRIFLAENTTYPVLQFSLDLYNLVHTLLVTCISLALLFIPKEENRTITDINKAFMLKFGINRKEQEIIALLLEGYTSRKIGEKICLSQQTIKNYTHRIYRKTGVNNKIELMNKIVEFMNP